MPKPTLKDIYRPSHDEAARHAFVGALKGYVNGPLEERLARRYDEELKPAFVEKHGRTPDNRLDGTEALSEDHLYQLWGSSVFTSQDLMWETVGATCDRLLPEFEARRQSLAKREVLGCLELDRGFCSTGSHSPCGDPSSTGRLFRATGRYKLELGHELFGHRRALSRCEGSVRG